MTTTRDNFTLLTLVGILLVAVNLRPALTSVAPVLTSIADSLSLSGIGPSVLTTLPVLFLGIAAPIAPWAAHRVGVDQTVLGAVALLAAALLVRPYIGAVGLYVGTMLAGGCIGVMGVLLPGVVKRDFPQTASLLTGLYTAALCLGAAVAAGATEPLRLVLGQAWRPALAFWFIPAVVAVAIWWLQVRPARAPRAGVQTARSLVCDRLAWQVTLYMGLQSALAYTVFGWLPTLLSDRGMAAVDAGLALSTSILIQIPSAIAAPWVASHMRDQRLVCVSAVVFTLVGLGGCVVAPIAGVWFWVVVLGLGQGASFSMALTLIAIRARDADVAARLSSMAQGIGYTLAAGGPLVAGLLREAFGGWQVPGAVLGLIGIVAMLAGLAAGRRRFVLEVV